jgi:hypothetical protein
VLYVLKKSGLPHMPAIISTEMPWTVVKQALSSSSYSDLPARFHLLFEPARQGVLDIDLTSASSRYLNATQCRSDGNEVMFNDDI